MEGAHMNAYLERYFSHVMQYHRCEFASSILESYILNYLNEIISCRASGENIPEAFGNLAFLYSKDDISISRVRNFVDSMLQIRIGISGYIAEHIGNFMEIVLYYKSELINFYLERIDSMKDVLSADNSSILSSAAVLPAVKKDICIVDILSNIQYPWRSYNLLASYYLYFNDNIKALNYSIKAIKSCPPELKKQYIEKRQHILDRINPI